MHEVKTLLLKLKAGFFIFNGGPDPQPRLTLIKAEVPR